MRQFRAGTCAALSALLSACGGTEAAPATAGPSEIGEVNPGGALDGLAEQIWQQGLEDWPRRATFIGDRRYDANLENMSAEAIAFRLERARRHRAQLERLLATDLQGQRRVTAQVLLESLDRSLDNHGACQGFSWDVDQLSGPQVSLPQLGRTQKIDSAQAAADYVSRLSKISFLVAQHIDNLRLGLEAGRTAPRVVVDRVLGQLDGMQKLDDVVGPYEAGVDKATGIDATGRERLRADVRAVVEHGVLPAMGAYRTFLRETYLPAARTEVGVSANPDGAQCYRALIRHHTSSTKTAEEIHQIGVDELARLHASMNAIATDQGTKDWRDYIKKLDATPEQHLKTRDALVTHNEALVARAAAALPRVFGLLPPIPVGVTPIEAFREKDAPAAYYYSASRDGTRPAYYYINTFEPQTRPLYNMEALAFHEAVPGHHLQISIAQALDDLPEIRRHGGFSSYVEGWALYSELVADELDLYSSPATKVGMFNYQAWRAARLVVDTGLHAMGWTRDRAIEFMANNVALPKREIANEIDRYIIWPGQALAYMLGRMEIQALRSEAEQRLGASFDLRAFHDVVLGSGAVPLVVLRDNVTRWLDGAGES